MSWEFTVRGFSARGQKMMETSHSTEASAAIEIEAWQARMGRGEVGHAELIDLRPGGRLTNLRVYRSTEIPWSWKR
jgi:hypothetical protein